MQSFVVAFFSALAVLLATIYSIHRLLDAGFFERFYCFDPETLRELGAETIRAHGDDTEALVRGFVRRLRARRGVAEYLNPREEWVWNNAGGAMGAIWIMHAKYIIIFGTGVGTEGHTGRLTADDHFLILQGKQQIFASGSFKMVEYTAGMVNHLPRGEAKQMKMPGHCFAVGYARGFIPGLFAFGYADGLFSTVDYWALWRMTAIMSKLVVGNLLRGKI